MNKLIFKYFILSFVLAFCGIFFTAHTNKALVEIKFPYKKAGLSEREAAAHLLNRFSFGSRPGEIDEVLKIGLEKWFIQQLAANQKDDRLEKMLSSYDALNLSNSEVVKIYPKNAQVLRLAIRDGAVDKDSVNLSDRKKYRDQIAAYMREKGLKPQADLFRQLVNQKILRAAYSNNQLQEVLTDFWFNHFNVSITKNISAEYIPSYERDVIRPHVFGKFSDLLIATAKSPAMLFFLDNFSSSGAVDNTKRPQNSKVQQQMLENEALQKGDSTSMRSQVVSKLQEKRKSQGLNENYAREVMELHTLGVDGGYSQSDVTQAARILSGWTVSPMENTYGAPVKKMVEKAGEDNLRKRGFIFEGDFMFAANRHDLGTKTFLGKVFPANRGYEEGVELLNILAKHPSTAKFISRKLAVRFVNDNPSEALIDRMSVTFNEKNGNITEVLMSMVTSPEFWSKEALREKTKSPFELAISAVRSLNADIKQPAQLNTWISKMGQKMYYYQAPTGFPDKGQFWINTGSLLNRMNFGLALASQRIPGIKFDLLDLNNNHEPESSEAALMSYSKLIMPERNLDKTIERLKSMLNDPDLIKKVETAASQNNKMQDAVNEDDDLVINEKITDKKVNNSVKMAGDNMLAQVVGLILGSPEFQRK
jgi:uncharacterized protein (DUF1800 family)